MEKLDFSKDRRNFCKIPVRPTRIINIIYKGHISSLRTDQMIDRSEEIEDKDLIITDGNGKKIFELSDVGILSVEGSEGSLTIEVEQNDGRSVFKTE